MNSKTQQKSVLKNRPRSSEKEKSKKRGRDGTPDKPMTPNASQDTMEDNALDDRRNVIINDEILALQIKPEDIQKVRMLEPITERKKTPPRLDVLVRKQKAAHEIEKPQKLVSVAKPAPPEAPMRPFDYSAIVGPRFDQKGNIVPHSILGSIDEFKKEALLRGDLPLEVVEQLNRGQEHSVMEVKTKKKKATFPQFMSSEESNALKTWQKRMQERRKQQNYLSKLLNKSEDGLVMNQGDVYRQTQEQRYLVDRTIPFVDYGKGFRVGSEFWRQQDPIGDELTGMHVTLTQTEKGYAPPIEHIAVPKRIATEMGNTTWATSAQQSHHKPWHQAEYAQQRVQQLQPIVDELVPHFPDIKQLEIIGQSVDKLTNGKKRSASLDSLSPNEEEEEETNLTAEHETENFNVIDPLAAYPDVYEMPVMGPSMKLGGMSARWLGNAFSKEGQVAIEARVNFEAFTAQRTMSFLEIVNDGTTIISYDWKKLPANNPFDLITAKVQRFYFNAANGCLMPGETLKFPFIFKSPTAGVFMEKWQLYTHPTLAGGASLLITLRGVAIQQDKYLHERLAIEKELSHRQALHIVESILDELIEGIRTPDRPRSPIDAYITDQEKFERQNPKLIYSNEVIQQLEKIYKEALIKIMPENTSVSTGNTSALAVSEPANVVPSVESIVEQPVWDFSIDSIKEEIDTVEDIERRDALVLRLDEAVCLLSFKVQPAIQSEMYSSCYAILSSLIDSISVEAHTLQVAYGLQPLEIKSSEPPSRVSSASSRRSRGPDEFGVPHVPPPDTKSSVDTKKGKGGAKGASSASVQDGHDKKGGAAKQAKSSTKDSHIETSRGSKSKRPSSVVEKDEVIETVNLQTVDPLVTAKYREKLYIQAHLNAQNYFDKLSTVFYDIVNENGTVRRKH